jgi:hypothetical protein
LLGHLPPTLLLQGFAEAAEKKLFVSYSAVRTEPGLVVERELCSDPNKTDHGSTYVNDWYGGQL